MKSKLLLSRFLFILVLFMSSGCAHLDSDLNQSDKLVQNIENSAIFGLLNYPDFYKVGVSFSPAHPDLIRQGEVYCGILAETDRKGGVWHENVQRLEGKLLIITGLLDEYFHSSCTFQLVEALVKTNKDFDLVIQPNGGHALKVSNAKRRVWDYVVKHLLEVAPPKNFRLISSDEKSNPIFFFEMLLENVDE